MEQAKGVTQLFIERTNDGSISMLLAKITDELLIAADLLTLNDCLRKLTNRINVRKVIIDAPINFNGCRTQKDKDRNVRMNIQEYLNMIKPLIITRKRRKEAEEKATKV